MKIYRKTLLLLIPLFLSIHVSCQESNKRTDDCDCSLAFEDLISKLEPNYIGLKQLQISGNDKAYKERKSTYKQKSKQIPSENCTEFLNDFLRYFNDGHLFVFENPQYSESELMDYKKQIKDDKLSKERLESGQTQKENSEKDKILGNWTDGKSEFMVIKAGSDYRAYISETTVQGIEAGELKAIFRSKEKGFACTYYSYKYSPIYIAGDVYKDGQLFVAGHVMWKKVDPSFSVLNSEMNDLKFPTVEKINENSTLLTIPSFIVDYQAFNDFITQHMELIKNSTNLIIDIRGNRGGNGIYFALIEIYATRDMEGGQGLVLASSDNLTYFERQMSYSKRIYKPVVKSISDNFGAIVDGPLYPGKKFKIQDSKIKNVAILTDRACASAAESFIIHSKRASTKVKTYGSATAGMIDYTSVNSLLLNSGKQYIYFGYPTSTLHKEIPENGYNETGILPDIPIKEEVKDKVGYILKQYRE